ncbi:beta-glucosidase 12 [Arachis duranensis]|uniref:Beta-glucosidase 12 n=1 Tax=Arachis duranensis TaxID=130453 RepID=A0A6P4DH63_ARADU|nr:beta-glucosidase 12 [Arachis duranensis]
MAFINAHHLLGVLLLLSLTTIEADEIIFNSTLTTTEYFGRTSFPPDFIFGSGSSAYQVEGAVNEGGRGPSNWDNFTHSYPDKIQDRSNGDVSVDEYHRYKEDLKLMKDMNMDAYRFSISWSRILPKGRVSGGVNTEGINYYNNLINELKDKGLKPFVTIFHWDVPQTLEEEYGGFLSLKIVDDFRDYAKLCFEEFGDRVKHWSTLNEPWTFSKHGYAKGSYAPGRCSPWQNLNCTGGDSATEPYNVAHHMLLAHAAAVNIYQTRYQRFQGGKIGITLNCHWMMPLSNTISDRSAAQRSLDFMLGWFMEPLTTGRYPSSMVHLVGNRLPKFSSYESRLVRRSFDFIGLNYYTSYYATNAPDINVNPSYLTDSLANLTNKRHGIPIGPPAASSWLSVYPRGIRELLLYIKKKYNNPVIYITENGIDEVNDPKIPLKEALKDGTRIDYYDEHLYYVHKAIKEGVRVKGFFAWSFSDNYEWNYGYTVRFGIYFVDYKNGLKRYPKLSATWFKNFLQLKVPTHGDSR